MTMAAAQFEARLRLLKKGFVDSLPGRLKFVRDAWERVATSDDDDAREELHRLSHSLKGAGATFGFTNVAEVAKDAESLSKVWHQEERRPSSVEGARFLQILERMDASIQTARDAFYVADEAATKDAGKAEAKDTAKAKATPATRADVPAAAPARAASSARRSDDKEGSGGDDTDLQRRLFLVSGDVDAAEKMAFQVRTFGYDVDVFDSVAALRERTSSDLPMAIISDLELADGTGADAVRIVQSMSPAQIPVIFASDDDSLQNRLAGVRAGGHAFFTKPISVLELIDHVDSLTGGEEPVPYRVLIVDDSKAVAAHTAMSLNRAGIEVQTVTNPQEMLEPLIHFKPDLILMDMYMPWCSGQELAEVTRQMPAFVRVPIVFLSSERSEEKQLQAMDTGGADFLTKPVDPQKLVSIVTMRARRARLLESFMVRDSLTGLLNHTKTKEQLDIEFSRAERLGAPLTFAMIDIDHFKKVNDSHGHLVGDRVIKSLARLLQQRLRKTDVVGRYGGEEFAVILPGTHVQGAHYVLEEIRKRFEEIVQHGDGVTFHSTVSIGLATAEGHADATTLNDVADKALYEAKRGGRNRVCVAPSAT